MDRIANYRELVQQALLQIVAEIPAEDNIRTETIFDETRNHFEILQIGWNGPRRVHGSIAHCDIIDDKIYLEHNGTDFDIAAFLIANGVPPTQIVLGFHPPEHRKYTEFAVA